MKSIEKKLKDSADNYISIPSSLEKLEEKSLDRYHTYNRIHRAKAVSFSFIGILLFLFYSANSTLSFAQNLKSMPILSNLLEVFRFEDELVEAIQEVGMILTNGQSEIHLQYVLSDEKRVVLYFQFPEELTLNEHDRIELIVVEAFDAASGKDIKEMFYPVTYQFGDTFERDHRFIWLNGRLPPDSDETVPKTLSMTIHIEVQRRTFDQEMKTHDTIDLGEFQFKLALEKTKEENRKPILESFTLFDIPMELVSIENSLLGQGMLWRQKESSTFKIKQLLGKVEDADSGALLANDLMTGYYSEKTESFSTGYGDIEKYGTKRLKITIQGANLMPRASENITIDLDTQKIIDDVEEIELLRVFQREMHTELVLKFTPKLKPNGISFGVFYPEYIDGTGNSYPFNKKSHSGNGISYFTESLILKENISGKITIKQWGLQGYETYLDTPLVFYIDVPEKTVLPTVEKESP